MPPPGRRTGPSPGPNRRTVLRASAGLLAALAAGGALLLGRRRPRTPGVPASRTRGPDALLPFLTPIDAFYRYSNGEPPAPATGASVALGSTGDPRSFGWAALLPLADRQEVRTIQCDGNGYESSGPPALGCQVLPDEDRARPEPENWPWRFGGIGTARWDVVSVADLFARLELPTDGPWLRAEGRDGYVRWFPAEAALGPDFLVAVGMNGEPLPHGHGAPARLLAPGQYGAMQVKWLGSLTFGEHDDARPFDGGPETWYPIKPLAFATMPVDGAVVGPHVKLAGAAFAGARPVKEVLLWVDPAQVWRAELIDPPRPNVWSRWTSSVQLPPGRHTLHVACVDDRGNTSREQKAWGDAEGYGGFHVLAIEVV
jgi:DMSO/TMAO reductase YedYZ molybdopterin-dependent catalytic subunit